MSMNSFPFFTAPVKADLLGFAGGGTYGRRQIKERRELVMHRPIAVGVLVSAGLDHPDVRWTSGCPEQPKKNKKRRQK